jgi:hypothetical protein
MRSAVPNSSIYKRIKEKEEFMTRIISLEIANHLTEKGEECLRNGSLQQSRENFAHALKMNPSYIHLQSIIGGIEKLITVQTSQQKITEAHQCMKLGRYRQANQLFLDALQLVPEKETSLKPVLDSLIVLMQGEDALMKQRSGLVALEDKKFALAIQLITEAIALLPKDSTTENAFFLCDRAQVYYEMKDYQTSIADCMSALAMRPELAIAYLRLGSAQFELEVFDEALTSYEKAMRFDSSLSDQVRVKIRQVNTAKEIQQRKEREAERARIKEEEQRRIEEKRAREEKLRKEKAEKAVQEQAERNERNLMKEEEKRMRTFLQRDEPTESAAAKSKGKDSSKDKAGSKKDKAEKEREKAAEKERAKVEKEKERERIRAEKEAKIREEQLAKEEALRKQKEFEAEVAKATAKLKEAERERELEREKARIERDRVIAEREKARQEKKAAEQKKAKDDQEASRELDCPHAPETTSTAPTIATPVKAKTAASALLQGASTPVTKVAAFPAPTKSSGDCEFPTLGGISVSSSKKEAAITAPASASKKPATPATKWASLVSSKESEEAATPVELKTEGIAAATTPTPMLRATTTPLSPPIQPVLSRRAVSSNVKSAGEDFPSLREQGNSLLDNSAFPSQSSVCNSNLHSFTQSADSETKRGTSAFDTSGVPPLSGLQATSLPFVPTSFSPITPAPAVSVQSPAPVSSTSASSSSGFLSSIIVPATSNMPSSLTFGFGMDGNRSAVDNGSSFGALGGFGNGADNILGSLESASSSSFGGIFGSSATSTVTDDFSLLGNSSAFSTLGNLGLGSVADPLVASFPLSANDAMSFDFTRLTEPGTSVNGLEGSRLMSLGIANSSASEIGGESLFAKLTAASSKSPDIFGSGSVESMGIGQSLLGSLNNPHVDLGIAVGLSDLPMGLGSDVGLGSGFGSSGLGSLLGGGIGTGLSSLRSTSGQWSGLGSGHSTIPSTTASSLFGSPNLNSLNVGLDVPGLGAVSGLSTAPGLSGLLPRNTGAVLAPKDLRELNKKLDDERITDYTLFPAMAALQSICGAQLYRWAWDGTEWVEFALCLPRLSEAEYRRAYEVLEKSGCVVKPMVENKEPIIVLTRGATGNPSNIFIKNAMDTLAQLLPTILSGSNGSGNSSSSSRWASGAPQSFGTAEQDGSAVAHAPVEAPENSSVATGRRSIPSPAPPAIISASTGHSKSNGKFAAANATALFAAAPPASSTTPVPSLAVNNNSSSVSHSVSNHPTTPSTPVPTGYTALSSLPMAAKPRPASLKVTSSGGQVKRFVEIPADMIGLVIGANGKNIKDLTMESTAKVQFRTAKASEREGKPGILELHGSADSCDRALQLVWNLLQTVQREYREITAQAASKSTR